MTDNWKPGDLALGIKKREERLLIYGVMDGHKMPVQGGIYTVENVSVLNSGHVGLIIQGHYSAHPIAPAWSATSFRKIHPHTPDEQDAETIKLLNGDTEYARRLTTHHLNNAEWRHSLERQS